MKQFKHATKWRIDNKIGMQSDTELHWYTNRKQLNKTKVARGGSRQYSLFRINSIIEMR